MSIPPFGLTECNPSIRSGLGFVQFRIPQDQSSHSGEREPQSRPLQKKSSDKLIARSRDTGAAVASFVMQFDISDKRTPEKKSQDILSISAQLNPSTTKTLHHPQPSRQLHPLPQPPSTTIPNKGPKPPIPPAAATPTTVTMAPITLDLASDFSPSSRPPPPQQRTLLLAPPSLAASSTRLPSLFNSGAFSRATTDLHMLDRLAAGLVTLPPSTYDLVLVLAGDDATPQLNRALWALIVPAVKPGGKVSAEDGRLSKDSVGTLAEAREGVLAGMVAGEDGFVKPEGWGEEDEGVKIVFGLRKKNKVEAGEKKENAPPPPVQAPPQPPKGVGFVDFSDDLDLDADEDEDDGLIDEETLLTEADLRRPVPQPPECAPQPGKKRRACKDCTCGLAERKFYPSLSILDVC